MNTEETLNYFLTKRKIVAPVAVAEANANEKQQLLQKAKKQFGTAIISLAAIGILSILLSYIAFGIVLIIAAGGLFYVRMNNVKAATEAVNEAEALLSEEKSRPEYIEAAKGFPSKFYNYRDLNRLYNLVNEGRAVDTKEAYNLLETQHFQETQTEAQEEMKALQADIASSSKITAVASTITAYQLWRGRKK